MRDGLGKRLPIPKKSIKQLHTRGKETSEEQILETAPKSWPILAGAVPIIYITYYNWIN